MAKRRTTRASGSKSRSPKNGGPGFLARIKERLSPGRGIRIGLQSVGWTSLLVGIGVGTAIGLPELEGRAMARDHALPGEIRVVLPEPGWYAEHPEWTLPEVEGELQDLILNAVHDHPKSPRVREGLVEAHRGLQRSHWFKRIDRLRWEDPRTVVVEGQWERPAAWVTVSIDGRERDVLVGTDGRRLPLDQEPSDGRPRIVGVEPNSIPEIGDHFGDEVVAGIALHRLLSSFPWNDQISSVDVSGLASSTEGLVIRTNRECSIIWGASPETRVDASEVTVRQKIDFLNYFDRSFGRIDAKCSRISGAGRVDLRIDYALWMAIDGDGNPSNPR